MVGTPRLFTSRVLLLHGLAFAALLIVTGAGVWSAYEGAQHQAVEDTGSRLQVVAQQTSRGIENYYGSILESIRLVTRDELTGLMPAPQPRPGRGGNDGGDPRPTSQPNRLSGGPASQSLARWRDAVRSVTAPATQNARERRGYFESRTAPERLTIPFLSAVWRQIQSRATHLIAVRSDDRRILGSEQRASMPDAARLVEPAAAWLAAPDASAISGRYVVDGFAYTLVGVRFARNDPLMIVAVVSIDEVGTRFLDAVQDKKQSINATLVDDRSTVIYSTDHSMIGTNLERDAIEPSVRRLVRLNRAATSGYERVDAIELHDGRRLERAVIASDPVRLLENKSWMMTVSAPLTDVGGMVNELFRGTLFWAPIVVVLFAGVMLSTALTLIRVRSRFERVRHHAIHQELQQARQIQLSWLPKPRFDVRGVHIAAMNEPASHVSGDFYNYFTLSDGRVALVIGDVTGHGMAAAFLMATTQLIVRLILKRTKDLPLTMNEANRALCDQVYNGQFVTLQLIVLDREAGTIEMVNAGHPPPVVIADGVATLLPTEQQIVLGVDEDASYTLESFRVPPDGALLLYTDGVVECRAPTGERFSIPLFVEELQGAPVEPTALIARVTQIVNDFRVDEPLADDTSAVAIQLISTEASGAALPASFIGESV